MLPIFEGHPRGWVNPVVARVSAALAGAGAWDAAPVEFFVTGAHYMTIQFTYTRGAAGGAFDWQLETSIYSVVGNVPAGGGEWASGTLYAAGAVVTGADVQSTIQSEYITFGSQGAAAETITVGPIALNSTIERMRIPARESADGIVATPGTLQVSVELW